MAERCARRIGPRLAMVADDNPYIANRYHHLGYPLNGGKPDVDEIIGLSPAISIDQKSRSNNPRSTVATITEIYDYLRILYARVGKPHCLVCNREIHKISKEEILETSGKETNIKNKT